MAFRFETLEIWHEARQFAAHVHGLTRRFPRSESFGLTCQMQRAADAVGLLIAEGAGLPTRVLFKHRVALAIGEVYEVAAASLVASDRGYLSAAEQGEVYELSDRLSAKLRRYRSWLGRPPQRP